MYLFNNVMRTCSIITYFTTSTNYGALTYNYEVNAMNSNGFQYGANLVCSYCNCCVCIAFATQSCISLLCQVYILLRCSIMYWVVCHYLMRTTPPYTTGYSKYQVAFRTHCHWCAPAPVGVLGIGIGLGRVRGRGVVRKTSTAAWLKL